MPQCPLSSPSIWNYDKSQHCNVRHSGDRYNVNFRSSRDTYIQALSTRCLSPFTVCSLSCAPLRRGVINLSREAFAPQGSSYNLCYKDADYGHRKKYSVSGTSCSDLRLLLRILRGHRPPQIWGLQSRQADLMYRQLRCDLLDWIVERWSEGADDECNLRLFPDNVEG